MRVDRLELLQLHRLDPDVPLDDQLGALRDLRDEGKIGRIGLSEITLAELDRAREIVDIASVQNRYSVLDREHEPVLAACESAGIAFLPWRPLGNADADRTEVEAVASELGVSGSRVCLAWLLERSPVVLPIPGTADIDHLADNTAAADLRLSAEQHERLAARQ